MRVNYIIMGSKTIFALHFIAMFFMALSLPDTYAQVAANQTSIEQTVLNMIQEKGLKKEDVGMVMQSIDPEETIININPDTLFAPASLIKVITGWAALKKWGPSYTFQTKVQHFKKSLCLQGGGDPSLVHEHVFTMAEQIAKLVKNKIETVYVSDQSLPTQRDYVSGFEQDKHRAFTAPISALSMNYNSLTIQIKAGAMGTKPEILITPFYENLMTIDNGIKASKTKHAPQVDISEKENKWIVRVKGSVKPNTKQTFFRSINTPPMYVGHAFSKYYHLLSTHAQPSVIYSPCPPGAKHVYTHRSKPLSEILMLMNKFSNNMIAETLFAQLGEPHGLMEGADYLAMLMNQKLPHSPGMIINKGSGLSRESKVTPLWFTQFLNLSYNDFFTQPEVFTSLSISGMDGTLKKRTDHPSLTQNIRGKTGSLSGITTLAGLINTPQWGPSAFSLFFKHQSIPSWKIHQLEKAILTKLMAPSAELSKKNQ